MAFIAHFAHARSFASAKGIFGEVARPELRSRSVRARQRLLGILEGSVPTLFWQMPVEPAFGRALDFTVGEGFAIWQRASSRSGLELTASGSKAAEAVASRDDLLIEEKAFLAGNAKKITETFVSRLLSVPRAR